MTFTCHHTVWKLQKFTLTRYTVKSTIKRDHHFSGTINIFSVKSTVLLKKLLKGWFHEIFWAWSHFTVFFLLSLLCARFRQKFRESNFFHWWVDFTKYIFDESKFFAWPTYILRFQFYIRKSTEIYCFADTKNYSLNVLGSKPVCQKMNCS